MDKNLQLNGQPPAGPWPEAEQREGHECQTARAVPPRPFERSASNLPRSRAPGQHNMFTLDDSETPWSTTIGTTLTAVTRGCMSLSGSGSFAPLPCQLHPAPALRGPFGTTGTHQQIISRLRDSCS